MRTIAIMLRVMPASAKMKSAKKSGIVESTKEDAAKITSAAAISMSEVRIFAFCCSMGSMGLRGFLP